MKKLNLILFLIILNSTFLILNCFSQWINTEEITGLYTSSQIKTSHYQTAKKTGHFSCEEWRHIIDSVWGEGLPTAEKLQIFDMFWNVIDSAYACFHHINLNWDSVRAIYRPEVAGGVSMGRFAAIMNHLSRLLMESHTKVLDNTVNGTALAPGIPIFYTSGYGQGGHFGAGLTPLPDSTLLVYSVVDGHPLGLERGDRILGYDRIPWRFLVREILNCGFPMKGYWGSAPSSHNHALLMSAGMNWHLFDTIDIVKYNSGDTLHLATAALIGQNMSLICTEQMDITGVPKPDYMAGQRVSYGTVSGTNIGYIYCWGLSNNAKIEFFNAVNSLMQTDGLIIDFRYNSGGNMFLSDSALSLLFDSTYVTIDFGKRCMPSNHLMMCPFMIPSYYMINGNYPGYTKKIAVLTGPGAVSSGDQVALRMKFHPHARFFGKSTATAFTSPVMLSLNTGWTSAYAPYDSYIYTIPDSYLTHEEFTVDENVWLTPSLVRQGRDDVVEAALHWIDSNLIGINNEFTGITDKYNLNQNYPNPFNHFTVISYELKTKSNVILKVFDITGKEIATLVNEQKQPGRYEVRWNAMDFPSGVYFYSMGVNREKPFVRKMLLLK